MRKTLSRRILFPAALLICYVAQAQTARERLAIASASAVLHEEIDDTCELIEPVTVEEYSDYDALSLADKSGTIYSPELSKNDYLVLAKDSDPDVVRSARESGFRVRLQEQVDREAATMGGRSCPDLPAAREQAKHLRSDRRAQLQSRLHKVDSKTTRPKPGSNVHLLLPAEVATTAEGAGKHYGKEGFVRVAFIVGVQGRVLKAQVTEKLDAVLDRKAVDTVLQWRFEPARMHGLPVPAAGHADLHFVRDLK